MFMHCVYCMCVLQEFEDRNQLAGYIMMMNGNFNSAQDLFMKSSNPKLALEVCETRVCFTVGY